MPRLQALAGRPVPLVNADVRDSTALRAVFHDHPIAAVVHCAGLKARRRVGGASARVLQTMAVVGGIALARGDRASGRGRSTLVSARRRHTCLRPAATVPVTERRAPLRPRASTRDTKRVVDSILPARSRAAPGAGIPNWHHEDVVPTFKSGAARRRAQLGVRVWAARRRPARLVRLLDASHRASSAASARQARACGSTAPTGPRRDGHVWRSARPRLRRHLHAAGHWRGARRGAQATLREQAIELRAPAKARRTGSAYGPALHRRRQRRQRGGARSGDASCRVRASSCGRRAGEGRCRRAARATSRY